MYLYGAYGSNLNKAQMLNRCPNSRPFKSILLEKFKLVFKGVADIEKDTEGKIHLGIYKITKECEKALDYYEEFPKIYKKFYIDYIFEGKKEKILCYTMNKLFSYATPSEKYFKVIKQGYYDWSFNLDNLNDAGLHCLENNTSNGYKSKNWYDQKSISRKFLNLVS